MPLIDTFSEFLSIVSKEFNFEKKTIILYDKIGHLREAHLRNIGLFYRLDKCVFCFSSIDRVKPTSFWSTRISLSASHWSKGKIFI